MRSLPHLMIIRSIDTPCSPKVRIASLRHCTSLRSIHLFLNADALLEHIHLFPGLILPHLPSTLLVLELGFYTDCSWTDVLGSWIMGLQTKSKEHAADSGPLDLLHRELKKSRLVNLKQVRIVHEELGDNPFAEPEETALTKDMRWCVESVFPQMSAEGMLSFETGPVST